MKARETKIKAFILNSCLAPSKYFPYAKSWSLYFTGAEDWLHGALKAHIPINPRPQYTLLIHLKRFWEIHIVSQYFIGLGVGCMVLGRPINPNIQGAPLLIYLKGSWEIHILSISLFTIHGSDISCIQSLMHQSPIHQITVVETFILHFVSYLGT